MTKITLLFILLYSSCFSLDAEEYPFIGLNVSTHSIDLMDENTRETVIGIRYGRQTVDWRTVFSYEYSNGYQSLGIEIDKILLDALFNTAKIRPYLGVGAGALRLENELIAKSNGYYVGANLGLILYATDTVDIDISYHYNSIYDIEAVDRMHGATLGLHYFF